MWFRGIPYARTGGGLSACFRVAVAISLAVMAAMAPAQAAAKRPHLDAARTVDAPNGFSGVCARYSWACARSGRASPAGHDVLALAEKVNASINRQTREVADEVQYKRAEYWALPTARGGDCEDFALAKKQALIAGGVAPERLLIATVLDRRRNPHAILVLRTDAGDYVLDNLTNRILGWRETGYTFLRMQNPASPDQWSAVLAGGVLGG